jgi:fatty-acyl-CoA synthase
MSDPDKIRDLADVEALEQTPIEARLADFGSTYDVFRLGAQRYGEAPALHFLPDAGAEEAVTLSYREMFAQITRAANLFHSLGVGPEDAVSFILPNLPQTHMVIWGGAAAGIVNPINPFLEPAHIAGIMNAAQSRVLVTLAPGADAGAWDKVAALRDQVPSLRHVLVVGGPAPKGAHSFDEVQAFDEALAAQPADRLVSGRRLQPGDVAAYFHTGGTTGVPKLARQTHFMHLANALMIGLAADFDTEDCALCGLPLFHVNAVIVTGLAPFMRGGRVVLLTPAGYRDKAAVDIFFKIAERFRASYFSAVPTVYSALLQVPCEDVDLSAFNYGVCGAAPMPVEVIRAFEEKTGIAILEGYGLTEGTCASAFNPRDGERRVGSIGLRLPYQQMKIVEIGPDGRARRDCAVDEIGVVAIRGPNVFPGYKDEAANRDIWVADGWFNTGDLGRQDAEGYFWLTGRAKDLIIRGGHNIDPAMIEDALHRHEVVELAAAVGMPDAYAGELPVAYVVLKPGFKVDEEDLREFARKTIAERAAVPARIIILETMPQTAVGKIFKPALRYDAIARRYGEALAELDGVTVSAGPHKTHGVLATVRIAPSRAGDEAALRARIDDILGAYAVRYEIVLDRFHP